MSDVLIISVYLSLSRVCSTWVLIAATSTFFFLSTHALLFLAVFSVVVLVHILFSVGILVYALLGVLLGLLCLVCGFL